MEPFSKESCHHRLRLSLLGHQVEMASDTLEITRILQNAFASRHLFPQAGNPDVTFYCSTQCSSPWTMAFSLRKSTLICIPSKNRPYTYDVFKWAGGEVIPTGHFSFHNSTDLSVEPTEPEMFAAYFQRRVVDTLMAEAHGLRMIHGGALMNNGKGILLLGPSKRGKSTLTLACVLAGMHFLSDDHIPFDLSNRVMHPFPRLLRLRQGTCDMLPEFRSLCTDTEIDPAGEMRYFLHPEDLRDDALGEPVRLTHVVRLLGFSDRPEIAPARPSDLALACADADFYADAGKKLDLIWTWGSVVNDLTCLDLKVGHPMATAEMLKAYLDEVEYERVPG
jgi:hypothetical protein